MLSGRDVSEGSVWIGPASLSSSDSFSLTDVTDPRSESSRSEALSPSEQSFRVDALEKGNAYLDAGNAHFCSYLIPLQRHHRVGLLAKQERSNLFRVYWALYSGLQDGSSGY